MRPKDLSALPLPAKFAFGLFVLLLCAFIAYQWVVATTILGLLYDSVCWVFPVCAERP